MARLRRRLVRYLGYAGCGFVILTSLQVGLLRFVDPPFTCRMAADCLRNRIHGRSCRLPAFYWQDLETISPHLRRAVLAAEDQRFLHHRGFDFIEVKEAVKEMVGRGRIRGASTISMQTARTVFLWPDRTVWRKAAEAYYTILVELFWPKERVLEIYLNTVDWGAGIMGAEAAARKYFKVPAERLTPSQAALLAAILPFPHSWSPARPAEGIRLRQARILKDMERMPLLGKTAGSPPVPPAAGRS